jgi:hypothetical protein
MEYSGLLLSRRRFLGIVPAGLCAISAAGAQDRIHRRSLVRRHNPFSNAIDPRSPLTVGNGEFAFTADVTGLQTFPEPYERGIPLCTQSQWGWHSFPCPGGKSPGDLRLTPYYTYGRQVGYPTSPDGQQELFDWLRENPHRLHLGRIGLLLDGGQPKPADLQEVHQTLDLWSGILESAFRLQGIPVRVETCCHPRLDILAVRISSVLAEQGRLAVVLEFPCASPQMSAADWSRPEAHASKPIKQTAHRLDILRELDKDRYFTILDWEEPASLEREGPHRFVLRPAHKGGRLSFVCFFSPRPINETLPTPAGAFEASRAHWSRFWSEGGTLELAGSHDARAHELERRITLSQYLTAIQCAGSMPPQETGLTCNSWYGKFHLEMHWWHATHFALWGRTRLLERSLGWYRSILASAREKARTQGYSGARWPKMVGPDGRDSPSAIGPLLIWQQPHPIYFAELCYRSKPSRSTLEAYKELVFESADFMASYAFWDQKRSRFVLGPPVIPAQENHPPRQTWNPTFELEYWAQGLDLAQRWRKRLGMQREPHWERVRANLSALPVKDGVYLAHENCPETYSERNRDHPSMLAALGMLSGSKADRETMRRTLHKVLATWRWQDTWGWDYPMVAMCAARLGEPDVAVDALMMETPKNTWLPNGHNWQRLNLPLYLPGNGGLLAAVAMMAAGWEGAPQAHAPGFPVKSWTVRWEGLVPIL